MNVEDIEAIRERRADQYRGCTLEIEHVDISHLLYHVDELRAALKLLLMFHKGGVWTKDDVEKWRAITGTNECTTKVLCDHIRRALGDQSEPLGG